MYSRILEKRCQKILKSKNLLLLGPRQVGKSTLIRSLKPHITINLARQREYIEHLKDPSLIERIVQDLPNGSLIFIGEVQRNPDLLNTIQSLIDENTKIHFALSGSSARKLNRGKANLLPGRVLYEKLFPITYWELNTKLNLNLLEKLLIKGSLPEIIDSDLDDDILESYVDIYLREEIQAEALTKDLGDYSRFLNLAAEVSGQYLNYSKISSDSEINKEKIRRYFEILQDTLLIHRIEPFGAINDHRRARQKDRFIFFDNGVRNAILKKNRNRFSKTELGHLFEEWVFQQVIAWNFYQKKNWQISSYRDDRGLEVDLIIETSQKIFLIEIKYQTKYRREFGISLNEFIQLHQNQSKSKHKEMIPIVVYIGSHRQKGKYQEKVMPIEEFLNFISDLD